MRRVADLSAWAIVNGHMNPDPNPGSLEWLTSITKTLAHIRGEEHAP